MSGTKNVKRTTTKKEQTTPVVEEKVVAPVVEEEKPIKPKQVDVNEYITVRNGHHGNLIYKSKRSGECFRWDDYGDEQEIQIRELKDAKNFNKKFFINNWFVFNEEDQWVIDYLGVRNFYRNSIGIGKFDDLFDRTPEEIKAEVEQMSAGQKNAVSHRAHQLIMDGVIDSRKCIAALEESLGVELVEK